MGDYMDRVLRASRGRCRRAACGRARRPVTWRAPLMNIRAHPSLVKNHNDIYDPRFSSFIREPYMDTLEQDFRPLSAR